MSPPEDEHKTSTGNLVALDWIEQQLNNGMGSVYQYYQSLSAIHGRKNQVLRVRGNGFHSEKKFLDRRNRSNLFRFCHGDFEWRQRIPNKKLLSSPRSETRRFKKAVSGQIGRIGKLGVREKIRDAHPNCQSLCLETKVRAYTGLLSNYIENLYRMVIPQGLIQSFLIQSSSEWESSTRKEQYQDANADSSVPIVPTTRNSIQRAAIAGVTHNR